MEATRVVEVLRDGAGRRSGSGYLVGAGKVLTAWHVVRPAESVAVRVGGSGLPATVVFFDAARDLALLDVPAAPALPPTRIGSPEGDFAVASVAGYPWWKRRPDGSYALAHEQGSIAVQANDRERTLQLTVAPPAPHPDPESSPWQGISGGPVFANGRLVGVLARHHAREGLNRLTAIRLDTCPELLRLLGSASRPTRDHHLRELTPVGGLLDRDEELAAMAAFCAGHDPYFWWQAEPWAGKSALMASFALDPPPDVEVVPYFVRAAVAAEATSDAFTQFLLTRLAGLNGEGTPTGDRNSHRVRLQHEVTERLAAQGKRLVLLVDGLDEDLSGEGTPSIASLLPRRPPQGLHVIVASRPHPALPEDVDTDHPLRTIAPVHLSPSPHAADLARRARTELRSVLGESGWKRDIVGFIAAGGGGLTVDDLDELTETPRDLIADLLDGVVGRTLRRGEDDSYSFAHETLLEESRTRLGDRHLRSYRERIISWAERYRVRSWPEDTPSYLFGPYFSMLRGAGYLVTLASLARDPARHDRMRVHTGGDGGTLAEIRSVQRELASAEDPDLYSLAMLTAHRDRVQRRNSYIPTCLPAVWARLGEHDRATNLLGGLSNPRDHLPALIELAIAHADLGEVEQGRSLIARARTALATWGPAEGVPLLRRLFTAARRLGNDELAAEITIDLVRSAPNTMSADAPVQVLGESGRFDDAAALAATFPPVRHRRALLGLAAQAVELGDTDRATTFLWTARELTDDGDLDFPQAFDMATLASTLGLALDLPDVPPDLGDAETLDRLARAALRDGEQRMFVQLMELLVELTEADAVHFRGYWGLDVAVEAGAHDVVERLSAAYAETGHHDWLLVHLASGYLAIGEKERARDAVRAAERSLRNADARPGPPSIELLKAVAVGFLRNGDVDTVTHIVRPFRTAHVLKVLATGADAGAIDTALRVARRLDTGLRWPLHLSCCIGHPSLGPEHNRRLATEALAAIASREDSLVEEESTKSRTIFDETCSNVAISLAMGGDPKEALPIALDIRDPEIRDLSLATVARCLWKHGDPEAAMDLVSELDDPTAHRLIEWLAEGSSNQSASERAIEHAEAGRIEQAAALAEQLHGHGGFVDVVVAIAKAGAPDLALSLAREGRRSLSRTDHVPALVCSGAFDMREARQLTAEAMLIVSLDGCLEALATVDGACFRRVIEEAYPETLEGVSDGIAWRK